MKVYCLYNRDWELPTDPQGWWWVLFQIHLFHPSDHDEESVYNEKKYLNEPAIC